MPSPVVSTWGRAMTMPPSGSQQRKRASVATSVPSTTPLSVLSAPIIVSSERETGSVYAGAAPEFR